MRRVYAQIFELQTEHFDLGNGFHPIDVVCLETGIYKQQLNIIDTASITEQSCAVVSGFRGFYGLCGGRM